MSEPDSGIKKFTKKPVTIEATQWDGTEEDAIRVIAWILGLKGQAYLSLESSKAIYIKTLKGEMSALSDYYIIRGIKGEFYPCEPAIFWASYDEAESNISKLIQEFDGMVKLSVATLGNSHQVLISKLLRLQMSKVVAAIRNEEA